MLVVILKPSILSFREKSLAPQEETKHIISLENSCVPNVLKQEEPMQFLQNGRHEIVKILNMMALIIFSRLVLFQFLG